MRTEEEKVFAVHILGVRSPGTPAGIMYQSVVPGIQQFTLSVCVIYYRFVYIYLESHDYTIVVMAYNCNGFYV